jgi:hypothetical protein
MIVYVRFQFPSRKQSIDSGKDSAGLLVAVVSDGSLDCFTGGWGHSFAC